MKGLRMASMGTQWRRRLRVAVACAVVFMALTAAVAGPAAPRTMAATLTQPGHSSGPPRALVAGFLLDQGRYLRSEVPGSTQTIPLDVDDRGQIVGEYSDAAGISHGFLRDARGMITSIDVPGAQASEAFGINNRGQIVVSSYSNIFTLAVARGFLLAKGLKGAFTPIEVPGAPRTLATGNNDHGQLVGAYENPAAAPASR
jgi:uncharacterized membrane protein